MIISERFLVYGRTDLVRSYSNNGVKIERNGRRYDDAVDPIGELRVYTETDTPISSDLTEADKDAALRRFGVEV